MTNISIRCADICRDAIFELIANGDKKENRTYYGMGIWYAASGLEATIKKHFDSMSLYDHIMIIEKLSTVSRHFRDEVLDVLRDLYRPNQVHDENARDREKLYNAFRWGYFDE